MSKNTVWLHRKHNMPEVKLWTLVFLTCTPPLNTEYIHKVICLFIAVLIKSSFQKIEKTAGCNLMYSRIFVALETDRRDSAVPDETTRASTKVPVQPLSRRRVPNDFSTVISMCRPPYMTRYLSSPYRSGHCHCTCFARTYRGWWAVMTGTWPGFRKATASRTFCITCLIVATEWAWSLRSGSNEAMLTSNSGLLLQDAWCADQVRLIAPSISSSHWYSSASCGRNTSAVWFGLALQYLGGAGSLFWTTQVEYWWKNQGALEPT